MADWLSAMEQTYEYYIVDPGTWRDIKRLDNVKKCTINRDSEVDTLGSATIDVADSVGEGYIRAYLITIQNGVKEKHPLGTFIVQTPSSTYSGKMREVSMDAYTPLLELKENPPPIGYYVPKGENIMRTAYLLTRENVRAPVIEAYSDKNFSNNFAAELDGETWLTYVRDMMLDAKYSFGLDEMGRILFLPKQDTASLQPVWTYNDDDNSILYHDITMKHDLYKVPNVVEVSYSTGGKSFYARVVNDDPNSPISTVNRGREICYRDTNPSVGGAMPSQLQIEEYAEQLLRDMSVMEYTVTYTHGYCPVRLGDCVRINYSKAGLSNIKAKVISQSIKCESGCPVTEKAVFTERLWR